MADSPPSDRSASPPTALPALPLRHAAWVLALGAAAFHLAYALPVCEWAIAGFVLAATALTRVASGRSAFFLGFLLGLLAYVPHLTFLYTIFGAFAVPLWSILPFWLALYVWIGRLAWRSLPTGLAAAGLPFLWLGLEYFRCECYPLKFAWLTPALALAHHPPAGLLYVCGGYGLSALLVAGSLPFLLIPLSRRTLFATAALTVAVLLTGLAFLPGSRPTGDVRGGHSVSIGPEAIYLTAVGVQIENSFDDPTLAALEAARAAHPDANLFILPEHAFTGPPPDEFRAWCRTHHKFLIAGGIDLVSRIPRRLYNTAFIVDPTGAVIFRQAKSVPVQFFDDGLPAPSRRLWPSPWGRLGVCICYDLSYTRVIDDFAAQGAQALFVPTMDVKTWGRAEHALHARVAPIRAAEYGFPIFRVASSGISQAVDSTGQVLATAPDPGAGAVLVQTITLRNAGPHRPLDRYLAPLALLIPPMIACWALFVCLRRRFQTFHRLNTNLGESKPQSPR
ncbi:MAG: nitrilase-related carbon-nitrogen hydrolase [Planctomycetota bacterium]